MHANSFPQNDRLDEALQLMLTSSEPVQREQPFPYHSFTVWLQPSMVWIGNVESYMYVYCTSPS